MLQAHYSLALKRSSAKRAAVGGDCVPGEGFDDEATFNVDDDLLNEVRAEAVRRAAQSEEDASVADDVPAIDGYRELREIGRGGFSRVYEALQVEFDRWVAIKVLNDPIIDSGHIAEFERECRLMGNLSRHPNIVSVHTSVFTRDRRPCIVMELFSHGSYQNILSHTGPLALEELLSLSVLMAGALATAHQRGVIHGDVKPQNIFRSEFNTPALGDFGIAALADTVGDSDKLRASAHYAAPELLEQGPSASSPAADQYSLAATVYTLATGQRPHASSSGQSTQELLQRVMTEPPPRLEAGYPDTFATTLHKAMAHEPQQRHRDLVAFAAAIARTQQELGYQPTDIPIGTQQSRYVAATPQQTPSQLPSPTPTSAEEHLDPTIGLASRQQHQEEITHASTTDEEPASPPDNGSGKHGTRGSFFWNKFPFWAKAASATATLVVLAVIVWIVVNQFTDNDSDTDPVVVDATDDISTQRPTDNSTDTAIESPTIDDTTQRPTDNSTDTAIESPTIDDTTQPPTQPPTDDTNQSASETPTETSTATPTPTPTETIIEDYRPLGYCRVRSLGGPRLVKNEDRNICVLESTVREAIARQLALDKLAKNRSTLYNSFLKDVCVSFTEKDPSQFISIAGLFINYSKVLENLHKSQNIGAPIFSDITGDEPAKLNQDICGTPVNDNYPTLISTNPFDSAFCIWWAIDRGGPRLYPHNTNDDQEYDTCSQNSTIRQAEARQQAFNNLERVYPAEYDMHFDTACNELVNLALQEDADFVRHGEFTDFLKAIEENEPDACTS